VPRSERSPKACVKDSFSDNSVWQGNGFKTNQIDRKLLSSHNTWYKAGWFGLANTQARRLANTSRRLRTQQMRQLLSLASTQGHCMALHLHQRLRHGRNIASADRSLQDTAAKRSLQLAVARLQPSCNTPRHTRTLEDVASLESPLTRMEQVQLSGARPAACIIPRSFQALA